MRQTLRSIGLAALALVGLSACAALAPATAPAAPVPATLSGRIFLAGDSTVAAFGPERAPQAGWGQMLGHFTAEGTAVENRAASGRSTKSYRDEGRWDALLAEIQPGDVVVIQFGHNDQRDDAPERFAAPDTDFRTNLIRFVSEARARGGAPILVTPVTRRLWEGPAMVDTHGLYALNVARAAEATGAPLIDLNGLSIAYFESLGQAETRRDFFMLTPEDQVARFPEGVEDNTHFRALGACGVARLVAQRLAGFSAPYAGLVDPDSIGANAPRGARPVSVITCAQG